MASSTLEDTSYQVDIFQKVLMEKVAIPNLPMNPLEPCLIGINGHGMEAYQDKATKSYTGILDSAPSYLPRQWHTKVLSVDVWSSKEDESGALEVQLKSLPSHLRYEFFGSDHTFPAIVNTKLDEPQLEKFLDMLRKHRGVIDYTLDDINGISPSIFMYMIFIDEG